MKIESYTKCQSFWQYHLFESNYISDTYINVHDSLVKLNILSINNGNIKKIE